ncbi:MAG: type II toxin-antitoxin system PemK/MazF family toxin [Spirochaetes bacterium]|nr:MAG: type II toxin-antitoxin system PemK/MazF family toxin [Spirochaetota bacterium]
MEVKEADIVLCTFYFSDLKASKKRPVLVLKDNLPYDDFIGIPISSKINNLYEDENIINNSDFESGSIPRKSKIMFRKPFVISKLVVVKKYGSLTIEAYTKYHQLFCSYFECNAIKQ